MRHAFAEIAFTPAVKAAQARDGSRAGYARAFEQGGQPSHQAIGPDEAAFLAEQRSFVMATVSETGWPYVQHRGGPAGFLKVLDERHLAFADFAGNRQLISVGNVAAGNKRVALLLVDHAHRTRLKVLGRLEVRDLAPTDALHDRLVDGTYEARPQRAFVITVEAFDWNCPQHIPLRIDADAVARALQARDERIAQLEAQLAAKA
jgi:uncharacterized protein